MIDWWFRNRETGRITVAQAPNLSLGIFVVCALARRLFDPAGTTRTALQTVGTAALVWWAVDEIVRGVNPWRRLLGSVVLGATIASLIRS